MTPVTDLFVGGAGDRLFKCAKTYVDVFAEAHPARQVIYLPQGRRRQLRQILRDHPSDQPMNIIGHSWGAADVAWAIAQSDPTQKFDHIIGIDPVGKFARHRSHCQGRATKVITVHAAGSEGRLMDGNITARIARLIGPSYPAIFSSPNAHRIDAPFAHYDMTRMMRHMDDNGSSAEDWLLGRSPNDAAV
ncbi:MAG: hypothetical protein ACSHX3_12130 [Litorimonas sp.]